MPVSARDRIVMKLLRAGYASMLLLAVNAAPADVVNATTAGFEVKEAAHVASAPDRVFAQLLTPSHWWNSEHSYSGNAANFTLEAHPGGCWCETLPDGGFVQHMTVSYLVPGKVLRMRGALGPLGSMAVDGVMTWTLKNVGGGTDISLSYAVSGSSPQGFDSLSKGVDGVLAEAVGRLKKSLE
jgi:Polyketide cyclase / dehydrase and lipid transport